MKYTIHKSPEGVHFGALTVDVGHFLGVYVGYITLCASRSHEGVELT